MSFCPFCSDLSLYSLFSWCPQVSSWLPLFFCSWCFFHFFFWNWIYGWDTESSILYSISWGNFPSSLEFVVVDLGVMIIIMILSPFIYSSSSVSYDFLNDIFSAHRISILFCYSPVLYFTPLMIQNLISIGLRSSSFFTTWKGMVGSWSLSEKNNLKREKSSWCPGCRWFRISRQQFQC